VRACARVRARACACVRACACARVRARVRVRVRLRVCMRALISTSFRALIAIRAARGEELRLELTRVRIDARRLADENSFLQSKTEVGS
jgi:hypothetical protein